MYAVPPNNVSDSMALIVGSVVQTILAAPGAGLSYRLYGYTVGINRNATGVTDVRLRKAGTAFTFHGAMRATGTPSHTVMFPYPGIMIGDDAALSWESISDTATGQTFLYVLYYIDVLY